MKIGDRIKKLRKEHGMTQGELAAAAGLATITIGQYELGKRTPNAQSLKKIASVFNISIDYLLSETDSTGKIVHTVSDNVYHERKDVETALDDLLSYSSHSLTDNIERLAIIKQIIENMQLLNNDGLYLVQECSNSIGKVHQLQNQNQICND